MRYNTLKKTGLQVSQASFGCMSLKPDATNSNTIIAQAIAGGINLFDTADLYDKGQNEVLLGNALKGKRKDVIISTKVGNQWRPDGSGWDWNPRKQYILKAVDESLRRLQTDYIDLYLLHGGTMEDPFDDTIEAFERLVENGKIRGYGLSSIRPNVIREFVQRSNMAVVMTQYSLLDRRPEEATLDLLLQNQIGVLARGTVASGLLACKPAKEYLGLPEKEVAHIQKQLAAQVPEGSTAGETALRYALGHPGITTAVVGIRTPQQLEEAVAAIKQPALQSEERAALAGIWPGNVYTEHR
jgi:aryl-alcohol dehydrogenase-like predicted oxidoreductase